MEDVRARGLIEEGEALDLIGARTRKWLLGFLTLLMICVADRPAAAAAPMRFTPPLDISSSSGSSNRPSVTAAGQRLLVVVFSDDSSGAGQIMFSRSMDRGVTWSSPEPVSAMSGSKPTVRSGPQGDVYVVWQAQRQGAADIYFSRSLDGAMTWSEPFNISSTAGTLSAIASMGVHSDGTIVVVWAEEIGPVQGIHFSKSSDRGVTWSPAAQIPQ